MPRQSREEESPLTIGVASEDAEHVDVVRGVFASSRIAVRALGSLGALREVLGELDLLILDEVSGATLDALTCADVAWPRPAVVAFGLSGRALLALRVSGYLLVSESTAPWSCSAVRRDVEVAIDVLIPLRILCARSVGMLGVREMVDSVRYFMVGEALDRTHSKRESAQLLRVSRGAIQASVRALHVPCPARTAGDVSDDPPALRRT